MSNAVHVPEEKDEEDLSQWMEPAEIEQQYPHFKIGKLQHDLRQRKFNGLAEAGAVLKVSKKYLLHITRYAKWNLKRARDAS